jgi:UDP-N-acetylmuramyl pentapeptide phosphotransferase/UDP-N-acetylglucosamine-1-phosphate transferase
MKLAGIIVGLVGAALFIWHLIKVLMGTDVGDGPYRHQVMSLIGGVLMFVGIWLYAAGKRRARQATDLPTD